MIILWLMYIVILAYNIVDYLQTIMLVNLGVGEANPIINYLSEFMGLNYSIGLMKIVPCIFLGVLLVHYSSTYKIR